MDVVLNGVNCHCSLLFELVVCEIVLLLKCAHGHFLSTNYKLHKLQINTASTRAVAAISVSSQGLGRATALVS